MSELKKCVGCDTKIIADDEMFCEKCEADFWKDPEAVLDYFHFCGVLATLEEIKIMLS